MLRKRGKKLVRRAVASSLSLSGATALRARLSSRFRILMYHRVVDPETLPYAIQPGMFVRPESFRMQMRSLARAANVIPLRELLSLVEQRKKIPRRTIVLTFDDGWHDNFEFAVPTLRELSLPATIFLPTSFIGTQELFWTDAVSAAFAYLAKTPEATILQNFSRDLNNRLGAELAAAFSTATQQTIRDYGSEGIDRLLVGLQQVSLKERNIYVEQLFAIPPLNYFESMPRAFMNWGEILSLTKGNFTFGNHSHAHNLLTEIESEDLIRDLELAGHILREKRLPTVNAFCYPGGAYNLSTQSRLRELGIHNALITTRDSHLKSDPALFGRVGIHEDVSSTKAMFQNRVWFGAPF